MSKRLRAALFFLACLAASASHAQLGVIPTVVEFYDPDLDNYFITADPTEQASVDSGAVGRWQRTGYAFKATGSTQVCRFYGNGATDPATGMRYGPNSHFYTVDANECAQLKAAFDPNTKSWKFESNDFATTVPANGTCASGFTPVYRLYNNGFARRVDSNHRFTTSTAVFNDMSGKGWTGEGIVMCAPVVQPVVQAVTAEVVGYRQGSRFHVTGQNLDLGVAFLAPGCSAVAEQPGGTAAERVFNCVPSKTGALSVTVTAGDGTVLLATSLAVPDPRVTLATSMGSIVLELYPENAPVTVDNFLQYVRDGFYANKIFHRVVHGFVIQGGGFNAALQYASTRPPIVLEAHNGLSNLRGTIAMARTDVADSATSQFFINLVDNAFLDDAGGGYAVFGKVVAGLDVVDAIGAVRTTYYNGMEDIPLTAIVIQSATQTQ
jgi:cyclophilin family peptidyl-prolyl cis-trans isomerase